MDGLPKELTCAAKALLLVTQGRECGAGAVTAMVAAAIQLLTGATLYAKNLFCPIFALGMTDRQIAKLAKIMVLVLTSGAVVLAIYSSMSLVSLWLLGSAGVAQLFPGVVLGLFSKRVTTAGVFAGLISGIAIALSLMLTELCAQFRKD